MKIASKKLVLIIVLFLALIEAEQEQEGNAGLYTYWLGGKCMGNGMGWEWTDGSACMFFSCKKNLR